ncbi:ABC transporter ATP-binding protein [Candidatus Riflebacteria bacterium]
MLEVRDIAKSFKKPILKGVSFKVEKGEYFIILGKSGIGKTVLLEIISGILVPDAGKILLDGKDITRERIQKRGVGLVYQDRALFPHLNVRENIAYALRCRGVAESEIIDKVASVATDIGVSHLINQMPSTLSFGESQRVALSRTLISNPGCLLLDEPISALDIQAKSEMRALLRKLNYNGQTILHVTHDYEESIALANRVGVIEEGIISQIGTPEEVFSKPCSAFVASFVGIRNVIKGQLHKDNGELGEFICNGKKIFVLTEEKSGPGSLIFRSNDVTLSRKKKESSARNSYLGIVTDIEIARPGVEISIDIGFKISALLTKGSLKNLGLVLGCETWVEFKASAIKFIPG